MFGSGGFMNWFILVLSTTTRRAIRLASELQRTLDRLAGAPLRLPNQSDPRSSAEPQKPRDRFSCFLTITVLSPI
eukprot:scaffold87634_cov36-Phaeocystis_antarctica.AAC.1